MSDFTISLRDSEGFNINLNQDTDFDVDMETVISEEQASDNIDAVNL